MALPAPPQAHSVVLTPGDPPLVVTAWDALTQSWVVWSITVSCPGTAGAASGTTVFTNPGGAVVAMITRPPDGDVVSSPEIFVAVRRGRGAGEHAPVHGSRRRRRVLRRTRGTV